MSSDQLGRILLQELNCVACHKCQQMEGKQGPVLTEVNSRVKADYLKRFIGQPHSEKPGTTMPSLFDVQRVRLCCLFQSASKTKNKA